MLILETSACTNASVLATILFIKKLIRILSIIVPAILIVLLSIDIGKAVIASDDEDIKRAQKLAIKRLIYGAIVFFVPLIVDVAFGLIDGNGLTSCYTNATDSKVNELMQEQKQKDEEKNKEKQEKQAAIREAAAQRAIEMAAKRASASSSSASTASVCTNCTTSEKIAQTAEQLAWPKGTDSKVYKHNYPKFKKYKKWSELTGAKPTDAFKTAFDQIKPTHWKNFYSNSYGVWPAIGASCDKFVYTVVRYSGYDTKFPSGLGTQLPYLPVSKKWKKVSTAKRGDVCIKNSHIQIYLGNGLKAEAGYLSKRFGQIKKGKCSGYKVYTATE